MSRKCIVVGHTKRVGRGEEENTNPCHCPWALSHALLQATLEPPPKDSSAAPRAGPTIVQGAMAAFVHMYYCA
jgi:hypothetical protein